MKVDYEKKILNALLDKFERSSLAFDKDNHKKRAISLTVGKDKVLNDYIAQDCYLYRPEIEAAVNGLESKNLCMQKKDSDRDILDKIYLALDNVDKAFKYVGRTRRAIFDERELKAIESRLSLASNNIGIAFLEGMKALVENHSSHTRWFSDLSELDLILSMVDAIEKQEEEILLRNFSKKNFKDSKCFERNASKITMIYKEFGNDRDINFEKICKEHNIVKNSGYVYIKNGLHFISAGLDIDLATYPFEFALSYKAIETLEIKSVSAKRVISVENLTTFNYFNDSEAIIIYLGGFSGRYETELIKKIYRNNPNIEYLHMGDIDWGGFEILINLRERTGIAFKPYLMGIPQLEEYKEECLPLTDNDRERIKKLIEDPKATDFKPVLSYMLEKGYKLEQESLLF